MNREQKRSLERKLKAKGVSAKSAKNYVEVAQTLQEIKATSPGEHTPPQRIEEGQKVMLNLQAIKARKNYERMSPLYKEFVDANDGAVFTAHVERPNMISMQEEPRWLFWSGDLIKVQTETPEE